ncbi:hypothetical protein KOAAANKH_03482 [Brevundimonas sp. NIBR10]|uniref:hypothetical protein n=1 Tax=Brevundimonas sp. NIBR10 TaxID=3015997 RepID=UPI0022F19CFB|nr:hypothetical protein [Brevundimonas sp. NIBR10]WGM48580.1 hypothetical protein KOAAANKH_03482 [Brevundimonas sp. NIBR10]
MTTGPKTPWHLWVVGVLGIAWNAFGCWDYTMTELKGEEHLRAFGMTDPQITYFNAMPAWVTAVWAIGVWGGLLGCILLLVRRKWAVPVFGASLAAYVMSLVYTYLLSDGGSVMPEGTWIMQVVILAGCVFFLWYAWTMGKRGVLR